MLDQFTQKHRKRWGQETEQNLVGTLGQQPCPFTISSVQYYNRERIKELRREAAELLQQLG